MRVVNLPDPNRDPFDHSMCQHPQPVFPVTLSDELTVDLVNVLHIIWAALALGQIEDVVEFVDDLGRWVEMAALGFNEDLDHEVRATKGFSKDMRLLANNDEFDAELRRLLGEV